MKRYIVTGANGFIGRHLIDALLSTGDEIYAFVYPEAQNLDNITSPNLHVIACDLVDIFDYADAVPSDIFAMYHLAWQGVRPEERNNLDLQLKNIFLTLKCMDFAARKKAKKVIFPGSTNEYLYYGKPLNRDAVPSPRDAYGSVKIALRYLCQQYSIQNDIEFIYTIIAGIYADDRKDNNVIFYTIDKLLHKEKPSLTKLEQLWDYVYIDDVINALIAIAKRNASTSNVYAIGHGDNWPLSNYIKIIHEKIDPSLPLGIGEVNYKDTKLPCSCIDLTDLIHDTGFVPQVNFEDGISTVIQKLKDEMEKENVKNG